MILPSETIIFIVSNIYANSFIFHPLYPDTIYTTFGAGSNSDGLYKSTNCGNTWSVVSYCDFASCVAVPSFPPGVLVLGSNKFGIQQSVNDGLTWNPMNNNLNNLNVLSLTNLMLAGGGPLFIAGTEGGIYRHYPNYWNNTSAAVNITVPGLSVYRENANLIWAALDGGSYSDGMYKSTDYGQTWTVSDWWLFITDILINPLDSQTVYASDSLDGVKITRNGGTSWQSFNTNLNDSTVYCLGISKADTNHLYAGTVHGLYKYRITTNITEKKISNNIQVKISPNPVKVINNNNIFVKKLMIL